VQELLARHNSCKLSVRRLLQHGAELTDHLGYEKGDPAGRSKGNSRNGTSSKTVLTEDGEVEIAVPRDRAGSFEPQLIAKGRRGSTGSTTRF
jgi:transposase-like protein